jgi:pimeloyl-ACP methyl ester carboxylesterase
MSRPLHLRTKELAVNPIYFADEYLSGEATVSTCLVSGLQSTANAAAGDHVYARRGQLVSAQGTRLNLYCVGTGAPAVVFDSGWEDWAPVWAIVQPAAAKWTRACSYDRAGAGFSDAGPMPRTSVRIADELHSALHNAAIKGPYILVGHAFGGDNIRTFAVRYTAETAGLVLVEADAGTKSHDRKLSGSRPLRMPSSCSRIRARNTSHSTSRISSSMQFVTCIGKANRRRSAGRFHSRDLDSDRREADVRCIIAALIACRRLGNEQY